MPVLLQGKVVFFSLFWKRICLFSKKKAQWIYQMQTWYYVGIVYIFNGMCFYFACCLSLLQCVLVILVQFSCAYLIGFPAPQL